MRRVMILSTVDVDRCHVVKHHEPWPYQGVIPLTYEVDPSSCQTELGRWLASHVASTLHDDDGSDVRIILPITDAGAYLSEVGDMLKDRPLVLSTDDLMRSIDGAVRRLEKIREMAKMHGDSIVGLRVVRYQWPVYGSRAGGWHDGVRTPSAFFDHCAKKIRESGGVILWAGLERARLPDSLAQTMAGGRGLELLDIYRRQQKVQQKAL